MPTDSSLGPRGMDCACLLVASAGRISSKVLVTKEDNIVNPAHCIEETLLDKVIFFQPHNTFLGNGSKYKRLGKSY